MKKRYILLGIVIIMTVMFVFGTFNNPQSNTVDRPLIVDWNGNPVVTVQIGNNWVVNGLHSYRLDSPNQIQVVKGFNLANESEAQSFNTIKSLCTSPDGNYKNTNYYHVFHDTQFKEYHGLNPFKDVQVENKDLYVCYVEKDGYGVVTISDAGVGAAGLLSRVSFKT